jgi:uncharacterized protein YndB with AHSA1/START domain
VASIRKERTIAVSPEEAWAALGDWAAPHERLVPGFLTATEIDGEDRIVTFFNGAEARERLIERSEEERRLVWSIVDGPYTHHNGAAQVIDNGDGTSQFVWIADLLPNEIAEMTGEMMERGVENVKQALEAGAKDK